MDERTLAAALSRTARGLAVMAGLALCGPGVVAAPSGAAAALTGVAHSAKDGTMEGVIVIARREGEAVLTAVTTDASGRYSFPADHLKPGRYTVTIRAAGYDLAGSGPPPTVVVGKSAAAQLDLGLEPVTDPLRLASQLTTLEWVQSFPGDDAQKDVLMRNMVNCGFCHSLERIARSTHTADEFLTVIQRMQTYESDHSSAERIQRVALPGPIDGMLWWARDARSIAQYLATVNLSGGKDHWDYPLKTMPRPTGQATRAIVTVYPIPRPQSVIHDLDVDSHGAVWYGNTGWDYIGRLDPATGRFAEWPAPNFLPAPAAGLERIVGVQDIQVDGEDRVWVAVGGNKLSMFDPRTGRWRVFEMPTVWTNPFLSPVRRGESALWATGLAARPDGALRHENAYRLDLRTGRLSPGIPLFDDKPTPVDPDHAYALNYCYMMDQDANGDFLCTAPEASAIARADLRSGHSRLIPTPTPRAYPRRGNRDDQNRFWFGEFYGDRIGVIDLNTDRVTEYPVGVKYISPYYARPDGKGFVWCSANGSDRVLRLDTRTGEIVQLLMPVYYDARKVVVDRHARVTTVWLPNKNAGQLVRIEMPD